MTHNIIHDEDTIATIIKAAHIKSECTDCEPIMVEDLMKQYAEHTLVKFIDSEVERLRTLRTLEVDKIKTADDEKQENYFRGKVDFITDRIIEIESHKLKAQLTKSKPVDNS